MKVTSRPTVFITLLIVSLVVTPVITHAQEATNTADTDAVHVIQPGENLFRIALSYGLSTDELANANGITDPTRILAGQTLIIPGATTPTTQPAPAAETTIAEAEATEQVGQGGVEVVIVPNGEAAAVEQTEPQTITDAEPEAAPQVTEAEAATPVETRPVYHTIQRGENLRNIAQQYNTTEDDLITLNSITNPNRILAGQQLLIRNEVIDPEPVVVETAPAVAPATTDDIAPEEPAEVVTHTVQQGEYLSSIARQHGVTNDMIIGANSLGNPDQLFAGQQLIIPAGMTAEEAATRVYPKPDAVIGEGREIVIDLSNSRVYAFENGILMYEAVSSNGLPATPTVQGNFTVRTKVRSQTMSGPGYWLPNVEWVLYFYQGYALHGAYWHENWGQPMSHGCVNLQNVDAKWFFDFAEVGTPVTVQV